MWKWTSLVNLGRPVLRSKGYQFNQLISLNQRPLVECYLSRFKSRKIANTRVTRRFCTAEGPLGHSKLDSEGADDPSNSNFPFQLLQLAAADLGFPVRTKVLVAGLDINLVLVLASAMQAASPDSVIMTLPLGQDTEKNVTNPENSALRGHRTCPAAQSQIPQRSTTQSQWTGCPIIRLQGLSSLHQDSADPATLFRSTRFIRSSFIDDIILVLPKLRHRDKLPFHAAVKDLGLDVYSLLKLYGRCRVLIPLERKSIHNAADFTLPSGHFTTIQQKMAELDTTTVGSKGALIRSTIPWKVVILAKRTKSALSNDLQRFYPPSTIVAGAAITKSCSASKRLISLQQIRTASVKSLRQLILPTQDETSTKPIESSGRQQINANIQPEMDSKARLRSRTESSDQSSVSDSDCGFNYYDEDKIFT